jgi:hypothetical protein
VADVEWLKALAKAELGPGGLGAEDPQAVHRLARARIDEALHALREEAEIACGVYNDHARAGRAMRVLPLPETAGGGFLLLSGRAQLSLVREADGTGPALVETVVVMRGFERRLALKRRFMPCTDAFGSVAWMQDNSLLMQHELIIKRLMEDLTRAACEDQG